MVKRPPDAGGPPAKRRRWDDELQQIYEKTMNQLFKGANKKYDNNRDEFSHRENDYCDNENLDERNSLLQMHINKDGILYLRDLKMLPEIDVKCILCNTTIRDNSACCSYCESRQCSSCAMYCSACNLPTCYSCSIDGYNGQSGIFCLSCCR